MIKMCKRGGLQGCSHREAWPDIARGICAIAVVINHVPSSPISWCAFYTPFMIPIFFFLAGYFTKNYDGNVIKYLYNRVLKLMIVYVLAVAFMNFAHIFGDPSYFFSIIEGYIKCLREGYLLWFIPCLICVSVYFIVIDWLCSDKLRPMLAFTIVIFAIGVSLGKSTYSFLPYHANTAMSCLLFFNAGYFVRKMRLIEKHQFKIRDTVITGIIYFALIAVLLPVLGEENMYILISNNQYRVLPVSLALIFSGCLFIICLTKTISGGKRGIFCRLLEYTGQHSLIFFIIAYYCTEVSYYAAEFICSKTGLYNLINPYVITIPISICGCAMMLVVCVLSDRFFPALNGKIKLPDPWKNEDKAKEQSYIKVD